MNQIAISVIVPIYNVDNYLAQCLDSLYPQVTTSIEVILVNDGSTDHSLDICKEYKEKYPNTIIIDKENGGLSDARNAGTAIATGKYIYYLDSDDWLAPNALQQLYNYTEEQQCDVVQGNFYYTYRDHLLLDNRYIPETQAPFVLTHKEAMKELIKNEYIKNFAWGKLYLTSIAKKYPFKKGAYFEDSFWQHHIIHEVKRYGVLTTPLYYYRQREHSISGNFTIRNLDLLKGYENRMLFIKEKYPDYSSLIIKRFWQNAFYFYKIAKKNPNTEIKETFTNYWNSINNLYYKEFEKALAHFLLYHIVTKWSYLLPLYSIIIRIYNRIATPTLTCIKVNK